MLASWLNFVLVSVLLVSFVTRIGINLRTRDARLAELRQRAAEEDHIVRMGLLASGAAHELGTPLSLLAVILGDWRKQKTVSADAALREDVEEMRNAVARCKDIISGVLQASGEAHSEMIERKSLRDFLRDTARAWEMLHPGLLMLEDRLDRDLMIAADRTLAQVLGNLLDNAVEAGGGKIVLRAERARNLLTLSVLDDGPGFPVDMLETIGKPYRSTKDRRGAGLGLFLAVNVMRKLGGTVEAHNLAAGGALVMLSLPLSALAVDADYE
jgi:two-component system sensor histidine kinase RegB